MARPQSVEVEVLGTVRKANDLDMHVRRVLIDGVEAIELRDYIPSLGEYGRGYWMNADRDTLQFVIESLLKEMNR